MNKFQEVLFGGGGNKAISDSAVGSLKIGLISDELTRVSLEYECHLKNITPLNYKWVLKYWKPDILFVESAWDGLWKTWNYKIASYPDYPERSNSSLKRVVSYARDLGIPCVFWNKEDGVHFERFIDSAKLFDHIFTIDENCIPSYRAKVSPEVTVNTLTFPVQPIIHNFTGFNFKHNRANFIGSYSSHIHNQRRFWQNMMFDALNAAELGLTVIDRNSGRKSKDYRYPLTSTMEVKAAIPHEKTAKIYKDYLVSLNVNTVVDSRSMYSRRLGEILACGGIAVTNPSLAVERYFKDYCHVIHNAEEAIDLFSRLKYGPSSYDLERAEAGARYVLSEHTWARRLKEITQVIGL